MHSSSIYSAAALFFASVVSCHGVILGAVGEEGSPTSVGFQVDPAIARNCTGISPCQQDTTIIRDAEINANIVNECGRTELTGNIDVGENTENAIAAGAITQVKAGTIMSVTIHQVNADGAGPYVCDLDQTINGFSQAKTEDFTINVEMPANLNCVGASTGNVCTVRCRNNAVAGPFGDCFAVQQIDNTPTVNSAEQIPTAQTFDGINKQISQNNVDLAAAVDGNQKAGTAENVAAKAVADDLAGLAVTSVAAPVQTPDRENIGTNKDTAVATNTGTARVGGAATATSAANAAATTAANGAATNNGNKNGGGNRNGNANAATGNGNANAATGNGNAAAGNGRGNRNNNNKRSGLSLKWAKRALSGSA
ncbi:hypothetical protein M7I_3417 [Glarea lozoyensis 74030]|uniref:Gas1-like protein n=1 Tax=Glarea lozoyensis (strain ATCC 74030 / MF5533) TaxID=1104152 RepID=H0ELF4_GLAL7|nr:hypothetical protein M7I_3417 [Glarea lozoyensis 74030]